MSDSPNLGLPFIEAAQAQKHVTHNEAIALLDALTQIAVSDMAANAPPDPAVAGARVVVGLSATGVFAGQSGKLAFFDEGAWRFAAPRPGWLLWSLADACAFVFADGAWTRLDATIDRLQNLALLGVATTADETNPFSMRGANALFTARYAGEGGDGALRFKLNKESVGATVSQIYQTNWSARAETGLIADDNYRIKVSSDGAEWRDALIADAQSGSVLVPSGTPAAPGLALIEDATTGLCGPSAGTLAMVAGGAEAIRLEATGSTLSGQTVLATSNTIWDLASAPAVRHLTLENTAVSSGQTILIFSFGGVVRGGVRSGFEGSFNWHSSGGQGHQFYASNGIDRPVCGLGATGIAIGGPAGQMASSNLNVARNAAVGYSVNTVAPANGLVVAGRVGVGTTAPSCELHVNGAIRCASFTRATVPSASGAGAGAMIWVSNPQSGAARAFWSTGADWRDAANVLA